MWIQQEMKNASQSISYDRRRKDHLLASAPTFRQRFVQTTALAIAPPVTPNPPVRRAQVHHDVRHDDRDVRGDVLTRLRHRAPRAGALHRSPGLAGSGRRSSSPPPPPPLRRPPPRTSATWRAASPRPRRTSTPPSPTSIRASSPRRSARSSPTSSPATRSTCTCMHADGAGTKSSLAYMYWKETGDLSVWRGIAQDAVIMNTDDLLCIGCVDNILLSSTIGRNKSPHPRRGAQGAHLRNRGRPRHHEGQRRRASSPPAARPRTWATSSAPSSSTPPSPRA